MTPAGVIAEQMVLDGRDPTDGDLTARRVRLAAVLNHVNSYVHNYREWEWTYDETAFTVAGANSYAYIVDTETAPLVITPGAIPDFLEFGRQGHLYRGETRMVETTRFRMQRLRRSGSGSGSDRRFAIFGGAFQFVTALGSNTDFVAFHRIRAESITDPNATTELRIPDKYKQTVILPGMMWKSQLGKQDAREDWANQFVEGLSQMCALENPIKTQQRRLPLAMSGVW